MSDFGLEVHDLAPKMAEAIAKALASLGDAPADVALKLALIPGMLNGCKRRDCYECPIARWLHGGGWPSAFVFRGTVGLGYHPTLIYVPLPLAVEAFRQAFDDGEHPEFER